MCSMMVLASLSLNVGHPGIGFRGLVGKKGTTTPESTNIEMSR
jgi:hypothetical protein